MIKLQKHKWQNVTFDDICSDIEYGLTASAQDEGNTTLLRITDIDENGKIKEKLKFTSLDDRTFRKYELSKDDLLLARSGATAGKPYLHKLDAKSVFASYLLRLKLRKEKVNPEFVFHFLFSSNYLRQLQRIKIGGAQPNVNTTNLRTLEIPLPPLKEQKTISELFQVITDVSEKAVEQEGNLRSLKSQLMESLVSDKPGFGTLFGDIELERINLADVVVCIEHHVKVPSELELTRYIGLENIEPENYRITSWGLISEGTTFTKAFTKGDVLFGKRRAYLKKIAIAEFDGICSSDILVFRAKEGKLLPALLPFYIASESFIQFAIDTSAGSLSPRTRWRDLANFGFRLPDLEIQSQILEVFEEIEANIERINQLKHTLLDLRNKLLDEILG